MSKEIRDVLSLEIKHSDFDDDMTIRDYLRELLMAVWCEGESFSGKRPFGNSGWEYDLYTPLVRNKVVDGELDEGGFISSVDNLAAAKIINDCINYCFKETS